MNKKDMKKFLDDIYKIWKRYDKIRDKYKPLLKPDKENKKPDIDILERLDSLGLSFDELYDILYLHSGLYKKEI